MTDPRPPFWRRALDDMERSVARPNSKIGPFTKFGATVNALACVAAFAVFVALAMSDRGLGWIGAAVVGAVTVVFIAVAIHVWTKPAPPARPDGTPNSRGETP